MDVLTTIKQLLNINDTSKDAILNIFIAQHTTQLKILLKLGSLDEFPTDLNFIIVETVIMRYNRIGSEGLKSESVDVISNTFIDDYFASYEKIIKLRGNKSASIKVL